MMTDINASGSRITKEITDFALRWIRDAYRGSPYQVRMTPWQWARAVETAETIAVQQSPDPSDLPHRFCGLRVIEDPNTKKDEIRIENADGEAIAVIRNLAVPDES
jgi:hypothetical protein